MTFIVWQDEKGSPAYELEALSFDENVGEATNSPLSAGEFVLIQDRKTCNWWFGQVIEPQRNFGRNALARDSGSTVGAYERIWDGRIESSVFTQQYYYHRIALIGEIVDGVLRAVVRRPVAGSIGRRAVEEEVLQCLSMPQKDARQDSPDLNNIVGYVDGMPIAIPIDDRLIFKHFLVAGATGSGKSNTLANLIKIAQFYKMCVVVFDHKPDYQHVHTPNTEPVFGNAHGLQPFALEPVSYLSLYQEHEDGAYNTEIAISVPASEFDPRMLAATIFHRPSEDLAVDVFGLLMQAYKEEQDGKQWTLATFKDWFDKINKQKQVADYFGGSSPSNSTLGTAYKITLRRPQWVDSFGLTTQASQGLWPQQDPTATSGHYFDPKQHLAAGKILVIRINAEGREYGLFLSFILRKLFEMRRDGDINFPVACIIDEAQDIFEGSRLLQETAVYAINEYVRKGRSKKLGFVFAVQSASQIPDKILQNLNSRIIQRQNTNEELRIVVPSASRELLQAALSFGPGEALISTAESRAVLHAAMLPSPFELTKTD